MPDATVPGRENTTSTAVARWADLLCESCQRDIVDRFWWIDLGLANTGESRLQDLFECAACRAALAVFRGTIRSMPELSTDRARERDAVHEAGHAVVGLLTGQPLTGVVLHKEVVDRGTHDTAAEVTWAGPYSVKPGDYGAMCWAGQQAVLHLLVDWGTDTAANRVDARRDGWGDMQQALDVARRTVPASRILAEMLAWRDYADRLIHLHWTGILAVSQALLSEGSLTGEPGNRARLPGDRIMPARGRSGVEESGRLVRGCASAGRVARVDDDLASVLLSEQIGDQLAAVGLIRQRLAIHRSDKLGEPRGSALARLEHMYEAYLDLHDGEVDGLVFALVQAATLLIAAICHELSVDERALLDRVQAELVRSLHR